MSKLPKNCHLFGYPGALWLLAVFMLLSTPAQAYLKSDFIGGWPGLCEDGHCYDDGSPLSSPPEDIRKIVLEHQLRSPDCPTDLFFISLEYPENTGHQDLDRQLAKRMNDRFQKAKKMALELSCTDFFGCEGQCLPIGLETRYYLYQSSKKYLSLFEVERFYGNFRQDRHLKGSISYSFTNYNLVTGQPLKLADIFPEAKKTLPLFWKKVATRLSENNNCPLSFFRLGNRPAGGPLKPEDLLLSDKGATVALWANRTGTCRSQAVDLSQADLLEMGANLEIWAKP